MRYIGPHSVEVSKNQLLPTIFMIKPMEKIQYLQLITVLPAAR